MQNDLFAVTAAMKTIQTVFCNNNCFVTDTNEMILVIRRISTLVRKGMPKWSDLSKKDAKVGKYVGEYGRK